MVEVFLTKCDEYSKNEIKEKIIKGLSDIGFDINGVKNLKVAVKPNMLLPSSPEKAIVTHPIFFQAVCEIIKEHGGHIILTESPAIHSLEKTIEKLGYSKIIDDLGIEVADVKQTKVLMYEKGKIFKRFEISKAFFDADLIFNLPKFKTHGFAYITGALKNFFGSIPGLNKSKMHMKLPSKEEFSEFLLDLYGAFIEGFEPQKKIIHIMDAILAMEGEGPGPSGTPKKMGCILIGSDAVAVDFIAAKIAGLDYEQAYTITYGFKRQFCISSPSEIKLLGDKIEEIGIKNFKPSKNSLLSNVVRWPFTSRTFKNLFVERPYPLEDKCILCYNCKSICPGKAISKAEGKSKVPKFDYNKCIRCLCCMEVCPEAAIITKKGKLQWILQR
ncbi:MAG: DUF362 domain-containing protein [Desulfobacterales bacterium]|nr:DUF362 domain-containing protein [Desulfobacterales bacterium]